MIARRLWGNRAAVFAGLFIVLQPNLSFFSTAAITESLCSFSALCALYPFLRGMDGGGMGQCAAAGGVLGLACLARPRERQLTVARPSRISPVVSQNSPLL